MSKNIIISKKQIEDLIFTFRGIQVMTDRDLAHLYKVETRVLNQAVKRNIQRFPPHFRFQLNITEFKNWKSQIVISSNDTMGLRRALDQKFEQVFTALEKNTIPTQGVFFNGQVFDAYELASKIIRKAKKSLILIDNYIDENSLTHLAKKNKEVKAHLLTKNIHKQLILDIKKANEQYGNFEANAFAHSHDRFLIIDEQEVYHLGASLKDLGKKWFAFSKLEPLSVQGIINKIKELK